MTHTFDTLGTEHCPFMPVFGAPTLSMERGLGTEVWDTTGKRYLDFLGGIAVTSLGHSNPAIAASLSPITVLPSRFPAVISTLSST